jgi:hypothetical protein
MLMVMAAQGHGNIQVEGSKCVNLPGVARMDERSSTKLDRQVSTANLLKACA